MIILPKEITLWRMCNHIIEIEKAKMKLSIFIWKKIVPFFHILEIRQIKCLKLHIKKTFLKQFVHLKGKNKQFKIIL